MGIGRSAIALLAEESARRKFSGKIITLGRLTINAEAKEISERLRMSFEGERNDLSVFRALGFESVESLDYNDYEGATHIHDLNRDVPKDLVGQFDVVLDSGTLEHVFNLPKAIQNAVDMVKVGGRIIIFTPSCNFFDHGFYMFSPTLFLDYFRANKLIVDKFYLVRVSSTRRSYAYDYLAGTGDFRVGAFDAKPYMIFAVATKTAESTSDATPQQGQYIKTWTGDVSEPSLLYRRTEKLIGWIPGAMRAAVSAKTFLKPKGIKTLPYVGSY